MVKYSGNFRDYIKSLWRNHKIRVVHMQVALFFEFEEDRPDLLGQKINEKLSNLFDNIPEVIPLPDDAPLNIPVMRMTGKSHENRLNVSKGRMDIFLNPEVYTYNSIDEFVGKNKELLKKFISVANGEVEIVRIGVICTAFEQNENAVYEISRRYFSKELSKMDELSFHINQKNNIGVMPINSIIDISAGKMESRIDSVDSVDEGIIVVRDFNNALSDKELTLEELNAVFERALLVMTDAKMAEVI